MKLSSPIVRVSVGIAFLTMTLLLVGDVIFGLSTQGARPALVARKNLAETLAVQYSDLAARGDIESMKTAMRLLVDRNTEVLSTALRVRDGTIVAEAGDHRRHWRGAPPLESSQTHARVPIFQRGGPWGTLELRFTEITPGSFRGLLNTAWFKLLLFVGLAGSVAYFLYMRRTLRHLDPSSVIPARVKAAFDVLAEGVVFVDDDGRIVLANQRFATLANRAPEALMGLALGDLAWEHERDADGDEPTSPWAACLGAGSIETGASMTLTAVGKAATALTVNAAPVLDDAGHVRGAIVTFDDVTELEHKKLELEAAVAELRHSRDEIERQNEKLEFMATRDPLTNCLNRRAFMEMIVAEHNRAQRDGNPLSCIMFDIDHFKSVNDDFGHLVGDDAIRYVAGVVSELTRGFDIVCRYGGEEFCVLLPTASIDGAYAIAERVRTTIESRSAEAIPDLGGRAITISLGVSTLRDDVDDPVELVDRADAALYVSKSSGRNRTTLEAAARSAAPSAA